MESKHFWRCVTEGFLCAAVLYLLEEFCCSVWLFGLEENFEGDLIFLSALCVLGAALCGVAFWRLIRRVESGSGLLCSFAVSAVASVVGYAALLLVMKLVLRVSVLPMRELGNGDGLIVVWVAALFTAGSLVVHLALLLLRALLRKKDE